VVDFHKGIFGSDLLWFGIVLGMGSFHVLDFSMNLMQGGDGGDHPSVLSAGDKVQFDKRKALSCWNVCRTLEI
jgi:hypothetical protein